MSSTTIPQKNVKADPIAFSHQMSAILERLKPALADYSEKIQKSGLSDPMNLQEVISRCYEQAIKNPQNLIDLQTQYVANMMQLWQAAGKKLIGETVDDVIRPEAGDKRFRDPAWNENPAFDFIKQAYLLTAQTMRKSVSDTEGLDKHEKAKLDFFMRQLTDSFAPTNFPATNPEVLRATLTTHGQNILDGLQNFISDLERGDGDLQISKTNYAAFEVGKNLAVTPGKVVYQNELMQLIQYSSSTETVFETPLLIVPPWINKYYILDMRPDNSLVKWAVAQGHTVFMISWANPDERHAGKDFSAYMKEGLLTALHEIRVALSCSKANVMGYCIGGTLLAATLAYMAENNMADQIASATFLTTLIDFSDSGDLNVFIDDAQLDALDKKMAEKGFLPAAELRNTFSALRANDLIWSYVINNYMLGKDPFQFDLLYWNDDSTNMPAAMHSFYLRNMYKDNLLCKSGGIKLDNTAIDIGKIETPAYFLSTKEDHIAPWKATFDGAKLLNGESVFVLSASGHVAGVVNPPAAKKYHYWSGSTFDRRTNAEEWLAHARQWDGSWWTHWAEWIGNYAGAQLPARPVLHGIENAPGSYVRKKAA